MALLLPPFLGNMSVLLSPLNEVLRNMTQFCAYCYLVTLDSVFILCYLVKLVFILGNLMLPCY